MGTGTSESTEFSRSSGRLCGAGSPWSRENGEPHYGGRILDVEVAFVDVDVGVTD